MINFLSDNSIKVALVDLGLLTFYLQSLIAPTVFDVQLLSTAVRASDGYNQPKSCRENLLRWGIKNLFTFDASETRADFLRQKIAGGSDSVILEIFEH